MKFIKSFAVFCFGGLSYGLLEILYRGGTHISMFFVGGLCFWAIFKIDAASLFGGNIIFEAPFCALFVTLAELCSGVLLNIRLGLEVWDYSGLPFNLWGQICLPFSAIWLVLSVPAALASRAMRRFVFGEEIQLLRLPATVKREAQEGG